MQLNDALRNLVEQGQITADGASKRAVDKGGIQPQLADKGFTVGV